MSPKGCHHLAIHYVHQAVRGKRRYDHVNSRGGSLLEVMSLREHRVVPGMRIELRTKLHGGAATGGVGDFQGSKLRHMEGIRVSGQ